MPSIEFADDPGRLRYEARIDGVLAGFAAYQLTQGRIVLTHTEVDPRFEGHGVGSGLARFALDDVRAHGSRRVVPDARSSFRGSRIIPSTPTWWTARHEFPERWRGGGAARRRCRTRSRQQPREG